MNNTVPLLLKKQFGLLLPKPVGIGITASRAGDVPIVDKAPNYFLSGTLDLLDISFATLGALTAYLVIVKTHTPGVGHEV